MSKLKVDLSGKSALVTGAGAGCGRAIALALAASGASVAVNDLNIERADNVAEAIHAGGGSGVALQADVSNRFQTANMIERTRDAYGGIDILVNAAAVFKAEPMLKIDEWDWRRQIEVNITGTFFCTQLVGRVMADEGGGNIIFLSSAEAYQATLPEGIGYITGKAAVIGMMRQAARELARHRIRVNAIAAGNIGEDDTNCGRENQTLLERAVTSDAVAKTALYLCSDAAESITGQVHVVDSGGSLLL